MTASFIAPIVVDSLADLEQVHMADAEWGTTAWVKTVPFGTDGGLYVLLKSTALATNGTTVVQAISGSPIAGNAGARWVFVSEPAASPTSVDGFVYIRPIDGVSDDWPTLLTTLQANAYKNIVVMMPGLLGEHFQCKSRIMIPSGSTIWGTTGTVIDSSLAKVLITDAPFAMVATQIGAIAITANNTPGTRVVQLASSPGGGAGSYIQLQAGAAHLSGSTYQIVSIAAAGPNFNVTLDRPVLYRLVAGVAVANPVTNVPMDIRIEGNGMTVRGTAAFYAELQGAYNCYIGGMIFDASTSLGSFDTGCSIDTMCYKITVEDMTVLGDNGTTPGQNAAWASGQDVEYLNCTFSDCIGTGLVVSGVIGSFRGIECFHNTQGISVSTDGGAGGYPSESCAYVDCEIYGNTADGIVIDQGSIAHSFVGCFSVDNGGSGVVINGVSPLGSPRAITFVGCVFTGNTTAGFVDVAGSRGISLSDCDITGNGQNGITCSGQLLCQNIECRSGNPTAVITVNTTGDLSLNGFDLSVSTASQGIQVNGAGKLRLSQGRVHLVVGGNGLLLTGTSRSYVSEVTIVADGGSNLILLQNTAVGCFDHIDISGTGLGASSGINAAAGTTIRLGDRVVMAGALIPFAGAAGIFWSRTIDSLGAGVVAGTAIQIPAGSPPVVVPWTDMQDDDRVEIVRVAQNGAGLPVPMPMVTKIVGTSFTITPTAADDGAQYAYCIH